MPEIRPAHHCHRGMRDCTFADPDGNSIAIGQPLE
jgi:hypothetical protein